MNETNLLKNQLLIYIKFILKPELSSCFFNVYMLEIDTPYFLKKSFECWKNVALQHIFIFFKYHCVKSVRIRSYSGPYFPAFGDTLYLPVFSLNAGKYEPE